MRAIYIERNITKMLIVKGLGRRWPAVAWSPLSSAVFADLPQPDLPGPRWVRVSNIACGICATDLSFLFVRADPAVGPAALPGNHRFYLGHEVVGTIAALGPEVTRFRVGQRVVMDTRFQGAHCLSQEIEPPCRHCRCGEYGLCENASAGLGPRGVGGGWGDGYTAHETELFPVPDRVSNDQALMIEPMSVGLHAVLRRPPRSGQRVLVIGAGTIGLLTLQAALAVEPTCEVTALARYSHQADAARRLGAHHVISSPDYRSVAALTGAKFYSAPINKGMLLGGFDVIYDCVGTAATVEDGLRWARAGGAVVLVGIDLVRMRVDLNPIWYQEVDLIGSLAHGADDWEGRRRHTYDWVLELLQAGKLSIEGLITHRYRFEQYRTAIATAASSGRTQAVKVIFDYEQGAVAQ
jgi:threonine dehydrogenase-like Zn-dependent dehydrogenase